MISRDNTVDMHDALAHIRAIRPVTRGPIGAYSQLVVAGVTGILLRRVNKFATPGPYRMHIGLPNPPAKDHERASQCSGPATRDPIFARFGHPSVEPRAECLRVLSPGSPEQS